MLSIHHDPCYHGLHGLSNTIIVLVFSKLLCFVRKILQREENKGVELTMCLYKGLRATECGGRVRPDGSMEEREEPDQKSGKKVPTIGGWVKFIHTEASERQPSDKVGARGKQCHRCPDPVGVNARRAEITERDRRPEASLRIEGRPPAPRRGLCGLARGPPPPILRFL